MFFRAQRQNIEKRSKISHNRIALAFIHTFSSCSFLKEMAAFPCIMSWQFVNGSRDPLMCWRRLAGTAQPYLRSFLPNL